MLVKSPSLSLLRSSLLPATHLSKMRLNPNPRQATASVVPFRIFSRVFPFRLRYFGGLGYVRPISCSKSHSQPSKPVHSRGLSAHPVRSRVDSGNRVRSAGTSKSLIDDEDELSDWVSDLRTSSMRAGVFTDDEFDGGDKGRGKKRGRDGDALDGELSNYGGDRVGLRRNMSADKGRASNGMDKTGRRGVNVGLRRDTGLKHSRLNRKFGSESEDDIEEDRWNAGRGRGDVQGRMGRGGKDLGSGRGDNAPKMRGGEREFGARGGQRRGGSTGSQRDQSSRRRAGMISDGEQTEDKSVSSFINLIGGDDSDDASEVDDDDNVEFEKRSRSSLFGQEERVESSPPLSPSKGNSYLSDTRFDQCDISPLSLKATKDAGYEKMTLVQAATLPHILKGKDVMAKARTGTGKTVAFLLPSIEEVLKSASADRDQKRPPILVLVICPTRELASQAAAEANKLLKYHHSIGTQVVIGGTRLAVEQKRMQANPCQILVATPGRLRDHIENTAGFATRLGGVKVLVLDEADHLLDMGFRKDIERIISAVPKQRQTLLFSATIPNEVRQISHIALKRDHEYVNTVEEGSEDTHAQVRQMHLVAPLEKHFPMLYTLLKEHVSEDVNYKVLVFCTTAMVTKLVADLLGELNMNVREIHSRKPQSYRTRVSDEFRKSKGLILVTSDVSARGVDYPDVTLVIQLGLPADRHQYIHRLGRTGRKGKEGLGLLLLAPWEEFFLSSVKDLPISKSPVPAIDPEVEKKVAKAMSHVEMKNKESAYQAWLGYYNSNKTVGRDKFRLVELANEFSRCMGLDRPPAIKKMILGKMGLKNVPGLRSQ